jgi:hypothetical protein
MMMGITQSKKSNMIPVGIKHVDFNSKKVMHIDSGGCAVIKIQD